ncbi:molybdopterin biosynthesis protein [Fulvimarina pelagi HTCC2506]|uniref:Molybdopterin molybdenumtransferase n=1 Tax=Fulvimarina pelagi HTCC2506 TaxID=314231 RepID=Q0G3Z8_9HYPH|nr:gephyrin-like molybdotransferase Glp [Fulvimarina pelagi]EAU41683.1 molybdopterin biosynthesis protein [Fulvimarina pelagi HTCC2506]
MAQLSDDCFAFGGPMMTVAEAKSLIRERLRPVGGIETVALYEADGRILAEDIAAPLDLPPFANSAVDGYAIDGASIPTESEAAFTVSGPVQAGTSPERLDAGSAARIFTGAPMPENADTVYMQEDVRLNAGNFVHLPVGLTRGSNARPAGEDVARGDTILSAGRRLRPQDIALTAAFGLTHLRVRTRVRVAIFSTGNELVEPGETRGRAQLFDSNRAMLMAMARRLGAEVTDLGILRDDRATIADALVGAAREHDIILTSGGVSTGDADFVKDALQATGSLVLWRIAIKPGRPVVMGVVAGTPLIGLPGNPVASFVTFAHVARPAILALAGGEATAGLTLPVRAAFAYRKKKDRREYVRASIRTGSDGLPEAVKFPREGAGLISSLVGTDGLVELPEELREVAAGDTVSFIPYDTLF